MKFNFAFILMACFLLSASISAQNTMSCGLHDHDILIDRLLLNKKYLEEIGTLEKDGVISYVPVKYHIINKDDGTGGQSTKRIMDMHCSLNNFYADGDDGIQFYIKDGFSYINNTTVFEDHTSNTGQSNFNNSRDPNAINIFIPKDANIGITTGNGVVLGYYSPARDWIVIRRADANGTSLTAPHELGHFFSLPHPFNGWDFVTWSEWQEDNGNSNTAPVISPQNVPVERVNGSNCNTSGDFICDTPPSYNFFPWSGCNYDGGATDPTGALVNPDETNIMDYYDDSCAPKNFTPDQKEIIQADYNSRSALHTNWNPIATNLSGPPTLVEPQDNSTTSGFDVVQFDWEPVNGADRYLLEVDRLSDFSLDPTVMVVFQTDALVSGAFQADKNYHWRVTAFNPYNTCTPATNIRRFTTGTALSANNVLPVNNLTIEPNPVSQNYVMVSLETEKAFDAEIAILSTTGQTLQITAQQFHVGQSNVELSMENIPNGIYFMNIKSGNKLVTKKIIVAK